MDAERALANERGPYDLILADPPYDFDRYERLAPHARAAPRRRRPGRAPDAGGRRAARSRASNVRTSRRYGSARLTLFEP